VLGARPGAQGNEMTGQYQLVISALNRYSDPLVLERYRCMISGNRCWFV
jgi:hypothetical protein